MFFLIVYIFLINFDQKTNGEDKKKAVKYPIFIYRVVSTLDWKIFIKMHFNDFHEVDHATQY